MIEQEKPSKKFSLTMIVRNADGSPSGMRKTIETDSPSKMWGFFCKYEHKQRRKRKKTPKNKLPNAAQADQILKEMYSEESES